MIVDIFIPCFVDQLYPQTAVNMVKLLEKVGCAVNYNVEQTCCGQPAFNAGFWGEAKEVCGKFLKDFSGTDYIVAPSASCVGFVRNYYGKLFENSSFLQNKTDRHDNLTKNSGIKIKKEIEIIKKCHNCLSDKKINDLMKCKNPNCELYFCFLCKKVIYVH